MADAGTMKQMLDAGVHFGHQTRRWNPHMRQFIYGERNGIHIIDLGKSAQRLERALEKVREVAASGQAILYVGTKRQARSIVTAEAERCGMPYIISRWLGGTLTNWITITRRIQYLHDLEARVAAAEGSTLTKRERVELVREFTHVSRAFGGLKHMTRLPGAIYIVDPTMDTIAVQEANRMHIPIIAMCDTNSNPDLIDFPIPSNDDAIRAIRLITARISDAVIEGLAYGEVEQELDARQTAGATATGAGAGTAGDA